MSRLSSAALQARSPRVGQQGRARVWVDLPRARDFMRARLPGRSPRLLWRRLLSVNHPITGLLSPWCRNGETRGPTMVGRKTRIGWPVVKYYVTSSFIRWEFRSYLSKNRYAEGRRFGCKLCDTKSYCTEASSKLRKCVLPMI